MKKLFFLFAICAFATGFLFAEAKNALLIANAAYGSAPLSTPIQESRGLKKTLEKLGFAVTIVENGGRERMLDALDDFGHLLKVKGGVGFFHYGGHAVQFNGKNYLIPVDADISDERRVATRAVDLDDVMFSMAADTNIVILDSCRDNPFPSATRGTTRGLALSYIKPKNSIIVYSAEAGKKAQDGVFTPILTQKLLQRKSLVSILTEVRREVNKATGGLQLPKNDDGLLDDVYLAGYASAASSSVPEPEPEPAPTINSSYKEPENSEYAMWAAVDTGNDLGAKVNKVVTLAELKAGVHVYRIRSFGSAASPFCVGDLYPAYGGIPDRVFGICKAKNGFCIARTKNAKEKSLPAAAVAAAEKSGWKISKTASGSYTAELELKFKDESAFKTYLDSYERASDELAEILKAAK